MSETLGEFPVDDVALDALLHALGGAFTVDEDGTHTLVGSDFTVHQLLNFYSGYDEANLVPLLNEDGSRLDMFGSTETYEYTKPLYHEHDVIRALIMEIKRLRDTPPNTEPDEW